MQTQLSFWQLDGASNEGLLGALSTLVGSSRRLVAELVAHLAEVEKRSLHLDLGYGSMFAYCTGRLGFSEDEAYRRIEVSRLARQYPALFSRLANGELSLSVSVLLKPFIQRSNADELLELVSRQSVARARELLAARFPRPDAATSIRKLPIRSNAAPLISSAGSAPQCATPHAIGDAPEMEAAASTLDDPRHGPATPATRTTSPRAIGDAPKMEATASTLGDPRRGPATPATRTANARRDSRLLAEPLSEGRYRIQFTADTHLKNKLGLARDLMRHAQPDGDLAPILTRALDLLIESIMKRRFGASQSRASKNRHTTVTPSTDTPLPSAPGSSATQTHVRTRTIPRAARGIVLERDGLQCTWCGPDGTRCTARAWLEQDHVQPWARGGCPDPANLRLLCRAHNRRAAEREYGAQHIARQIARSRAHTTNTERLRVEPAGQPRPRTHATNTEPLPVVPAEQPRPHAQAANTEPLPVMPADQRLPQTHATNTEPLPVEPAEQPRLHAQAANTEPPPVIPADQPRQRICHGADSALLVERSVRPGPKPQQENPNCVGFQPRWVVEQRASETVSHERGEVEPSEPQLRDAGEATCGRKRAQRRQREPAEGVVQPAGP